MKVRAKKHLGQHFLKDLSIARSITDALSGESYTNIVEVGPGMGVLTQYLLTKDFITHVIELDRESVSYLQAEYPQLSQRIYSADFLKLNLETITDQSFALIGNFPYNISSQILFKALDYKDQIPEIVGMFQKEVAERVASGPGNKKYGIISVLLQAYYNIEYLFTVNEDVFDPPPKVKSGVIRLRRNDEKKLECNEKFFKQVVKQAFSQRRKTLRNALKPLIGKSGFNDPKLELRAERLSVKDFVYLTNQLERIQP
ncbi:MAG: 16S rRNA (adenine(1518)-N(6)/adenine(1519)-N(6))-dimethyltransferase [Bacteroidetes bacterium MED-G21]|nr:MAG: 16S rRNA (adenine(1518)-N(6)/adenine(1519)-N(6))-dimethyltransferase [Bacteroidetes bacterium MED-G21]